MGIEPTRPNELADNISTNGLSSIQTKHREDNSPPAIGESNVIAGRSNNRIGIKE
ncbi:MAG: hypothetical protein JJ919_17535 [Henriciella sp.]|nr:hypothetical protein [Henriciella sp.]